MCLTPGGLYGVRESGLGWERFKPIAVQKSAEDILGRGNEPRIKRGGLTLPKVRTVPVKAGLNERVSKADDDQAYSV